ncbi:hypothetical protein AGMMS49975_13370 [Clostridia bacterium]|nr:hypothetical protein AGMMS49975_13370 [Clostridia bacterium]
MRKLSDKRGFTLIELVVVIVILAVMALIAIPKMIVYTRDAKIRVCASNMRSIVSATILYQSFNLRKAIDRDTLMETLQTENYIEPVVCPLIKDGRQYTFPADSNDSPKPRCPVHGKLTMYIYTGTYESPVEYPDGDAP